MALRDNAGFLIAHPLAAATGAAAVTPHDTNELRAPTKGLWIQTGGNIVLRMLSGDVVTLTGVPDDTWLPVCVAGVNATSTTATGITAFF